MAVLIGLGAEEDGIRIEQGDVVLHQPHVKGIPGNFSIVSTVAIAASTALFASTADATVAEPIRRSVANMTVIVALSLQLRDVSRQQMLT